ncbi:MAG: hypothetical protein K0S55_360 [Clostridia bacterium]|jgi:prepilin-type N-terminal cleavage/methylation domain-containing protein|nr:hypothetical protein [Clostridia bacterium]
MNKYKKFEKLKNRSGFTIVELLIALTLLGIILGTLVSFIGNTGRLSKKSMELYEAQSNVKILTSYIAMIIRQNDVSGDINVQNIGGVNYLTVKVNSKGVPDPVAPYYWHIYYNDHAVYEVYNTSESLSSFTGGFQIIDYVENFMIEPDKKPVPGSTTGEEYLIGIKLEVTFTVDGTNPETISETLALRSELS